MPTNLPPEALEAERRYRDAESPEEALEALQEFIGLIPKHKGTDHLRAGLRRRLSKMQAESKAKKGRSKQYSAYRIDREGAGRAVVVGPTNVGKSALVATLTGASPTVSPAPFTTWEPTPGMIPFEDIHIQLIDTPPLEGDYIDAQLFDLVRRADLVLLVVDLATFPVQQLEDTITRLREHRIVPDHLEDDDDDSEDEGDEGDEEHAPRLTRVPVMVLANKADDDESDEVFEIFCELLEDEWPLMPVSATTGRNLDTLKRAIFDRLDVIRVYSKRPGKPPDLDAPFVMKEGGTVDELAGKVHKDFAENLKAARIWGQGVHDGQLVGRDHVLHDGDIVELRI